MPVKIADLTGFRHLLGLKINTVTIKLNKELENRAGIFLLEYQTNKIGNYQ